MARKWMLALARGACVLGLLAGAATSAASPRPLAANHAPVLTTTAAPSLNPIEENQFANAGTAISTIIAGVAPIALIRDDPGAKQGLAIVDAVNEDGEWEFSVDSGASWASLGSPSDGAARLLASDAITRLRFVPDAHFSGTVNPGFSFRAWDQTSGANGAVADARRHGGSTAFSDQVAIGQVKVNAANDPPVAAADTANTPADTPRVINLLGNDADPNGDPLVVTQIFGQPDHGTTTTNGVTAIYTPTASFVGTDVFTYTVGDAFMATDTAAVTVSVGLPNNPPAAVDDATTTPVNTPAAVRVLTNDVDPDGDTLALTKVGKPSHGASELRGATVVYTPTTGFTGDDRLMYVVSDGVLTDTGILTITVTPASAYPWQETHFDELAPGCLDGQGGWRLAELGGACAETVLEGSNRVLRADPPAGATIALDKDVPAQAGGRHTFVFRVKVTDAVATATQPLAKLVIRTSPPRDGWDAKFQIYLGASIAVNYNRRGGTKTLVPLTESGRWYHIRGVMDLDREQLDVWVDGRQVANGIGMNRGPIAGLSLAAWDRSGAVFIDDVVGLKNDPSDDGTGSYWMNSRGGLWRDAASWSKGSVPDTSTRAFVTLNGVYEVTIDQNAAVAGLLNGGGAASAPTLTIGGNAGLTVKNNALNAGTMRLRSAGGAYKASLSVSGLLTNNGTIESAQGAGGERAISGKLLNQGTLRVGWPLTFSGNLANAKTLTIDAGQRLTIPGGASVLDQNAGAIDGAGVLELRDGATLNFAGGTTNPAAPPLLTNAILAFKAGASSAAGFVLRGASQLKGNVGARQTVSIRADAQFDRTAVTTPGGLTNAGTIRLESVDSTRGANLVVRGLLTNLGTIESGDGAGGAHSIAGDILNRGTIQVDRNLAHAGALDNVGVIGISFGPDKTVADRMDIAKAARLAGTLLLSPKTGFNPSIGRGYTLLSFASRVGEFGLVKGRDLGGGKCLSIAYGNIDITATVTKCDDRAIKNLAAGSDSPTIVGGTTTLTATVADGNNLAYAWNFGDGTIGGGAVASHVYPAVGSYTAIVTATNLINSQSASTRVTVTPEAVLRGQVGLQGRPAAPNLAWSIPLTVTLTPTTLGLPEYTLRTTTDRTGAFTLDGLVPGVYDVRVKGAHTLRNLVRKVTLAAGQNRQHLGLLLEGDVETGATFNYVTDADYAALLASFNLCAGAAGYRPNADLDGSGCVTIADLGLLSGNFGWKGDIAATPGQAPPPAGGSPALTIEPAQNHVDKHEPITVTVMLDPRGAVINGVMANLRFDPAKLEVISAKLVPVLSTVLVAPAIDNQRGTVRFGAALLGQAVASKFAVATIAVRLKSEAGPAALTPVLDQAPATAASWSQGSLPLTASGATFLPEQHVYIPIAQR